MSAQDVIKNFMAVLDNTSNQGVPALDEAVAAVSNFQSWTQMVKTMAADCAAYGTNGAGFLADMCGIVLGNDDTGAITGSDAGGGTTKTAESIVPESGNWTYPSSGTFTINGLTVNIENFDSLGASEQWIVGAMYTWWIRESLSLINSSYGYSFNEAGTTVKTLNVQFYNAADGKMAASRYSSGQKSTELYLRINMNFFDGIDTTNPNGVAPATSGALNYLDRTIAHELVHAVMSANVDWYANLPTYFKEGSAELVHGIDDKRYSTIQNLSTNSTALQNSALSGSGTESYAAGYIALRYLAKQAAAGRDPSVATAPTSTVATDTASTVASTTDTTSTAVMDTTSTSTIDTASTTATGSNNFLYVLGSGQNLTFNFRTGTAGDVLSFIGGGITAFLRDGNVLAAFMADGGSVTVVTDDATAGNTINYSVDGTNVLYAKIGNTNTTNNFVYEGDGVVYLGGLAVDMVNIFTPNVTVNLAGGNFSGVEVLNAMNSGGANVLFGDAATNQIYSGGNGSALWGGVGMTDDILQGNNGVDVFLYGRNEGNDVIVNAGDEDTINLYNATLADITLAQETDSGLLIGVGTNVLAVVGTNNTSVAFADGSTVRYNRAAKTWTLTSNHGTVLG